MQTEKLRLSGTLAEFQDRTQREIGTRPDWNWTDLAKKIQEIALEVCGKTEKEVADPWLNTHSQECVRFRTEITRNVKHCHTLLEQGKAATQENRDHRDQVKTLRKDFKRSKRRWEREYGEEIINQATEACTRHEIGTMYKILRKIGSKENKSASPSESFSAVEFKEHFSKVSEARNEQSRERIEETISWIPDKRNDPEFRRNADKLSEPITIAEIMTEWSKISDGAPGKDQVKITMIKACDKKYQMIIARTIQHMSEEEPDQWDRVMKEGVVVPLFMKGDRKNLGNFRGVCLLAMGSRILERVMATRLRSWAELNRLMDDNQHGFRTGRSTAVAAQILIRINEELKTESEAHSPEDPMAILLDITKAYPRVNKTILWAMLKKYAVKGRGLRILQGLHEKTSYEVKGREKNSNQWTAERGLREGCATSPTLFNVYHSTSMRVASIEGQKRAKENRHSGQVGIQWQWIPSDSLPPQDKTKARDNSVCQEHNISEILFADDTTLCGTRAEIQQGRNCVVEILERFEEKCNTDKEEVMRIGHLSGGKIRILGSYSCSKKKEREDAKSGIHNQKTNMQIDTIQTHPSKNSGSVRRIHRTL